METTYKNWNPSGQEELSVEEQKYVPRKRGFHIPQFIRRNSAITCCAILGIGLVCSIALMSKEISGINTNIKLYQEKSNQSAESRNSVLEELAELKKKTGRIAKDVAQVMGELHNFTAALKQTPVLDKLTELKGLAGKMARDVIQLLGEFRDFTEGLCTGCPQNWVLFEKHCYFFSTSSNPWLTAKQACEKEGAHLVVINFQAEQSFLVKQFASEHVFWIGLSDTIKEGEWRWVDGTPFSISFWGPGEPNNAGQGEDCATLLFNGKWNDATCQGREYWICEKEC